MPGTQWRWKGGGLLDSGVRHEDGLGNLGGASGLGEGHGANSAGGESNGSSHFMRCGPGNTTRAN